MICLSACSIQNAEEIESAEEENKINESSEARVISSGQPSENVREKEEPETDSGEKLATNESISIANNGSFFVQYGEFVYYREYNNESFEKDAVFAEYSGIPNTSKKMMRIDSDGNKEALFDDTGSGKIFILSNRMFLNSGFDGPIYSTDFSGENRVDYGNGTLAAVDISEGILICSTESGMALIKSASGETQNIPGTSFLYYSDADKTVFFTYDDSPLGEIKLGAINIDGSGEKTIVQTEALYEDDAMSLESTQVQNVQEDGECLYFSYGGFAGTGNFYQGGNIARAKKDGSTFEVLIGDELLAGPDFIVINEKGIKSIIYDIITIS
jgi:hypothetical protein